MTVIDLPKLLDETQTAELLGVKRQTLAVWRCTHRHDLPYIRVGKAIRYRLNDLERWLDERTVGGNSEHD